MFHIDGCKCLTIVLVLKFKVLIFAENGLRGMALEARARRREDMEVDDGHDEDVLGPMPRDGGHGDDDGDGRAGPDDGRDEEPEDAPEGVGGGEDAADVRGRGGVAEVDIGGGAGRGVCVHMEGTGRPPLDVGVRGRGRGIGAGGRARGGRRRNRRRPYPSMASICLVRGGYSALRVVW